MGGVKFKGRKYAHDLRMKCFKVLLNSKVDPKQYKDPVEFYNSCVEEGSKRVEMIKDLK